MEVDDDLILAAFEPPLAHNSWWLSMWEDLHTQVKLGHSVLSGRAATCTCLTSDVVNTG